eukprot:scaffold1278_cov356-Prasinococcus_capsulatus_cf.AAC.6
MFRPWLQTHPAEFVSALSAGHMVATAILLNCRFALGTILRICANPIEGFRVIVTLLQPIFHMLTACRLMVLLFTGRTEGVATLACRHLARTAGNINSKATSGNGTPAYLRVIIYEGIHQELLRYRCHRSG